MTGEGNVWRTKEMENRGLEKGTRKTVVKAHTCTCRELQKGHRG